MYEKSIELLNKAVADELSAIHQYMYFHLGAATLNYEHQAAAAKAIVSGKHTGCGEP
jgi:bacterioferritin